MRLRVYLAVCVHCSLMKQSSQWNKAAYECMSSLIIISGSNREQSLVWNSGT